MIVWITGLAGAGKTTLGRMVVHELRSQHEYKVALLDGDEIRSIFDDDLGHTLDDRIKNSKRISALCQFFDRQGVTVVCCILSVSEEHRKENRRRASRYLEVFLDVTMETLEERDQKGLYSGARRGEIDNVVGIDIPFMKPTTADIYINNSGTEEELVLASRRIVEVILDAAPLTATSGDDGRKIDRPGDN